MKKGFFIFASVLAAAALYVVYTQAGADVYKTKIDTTEKGDIKISLELTGEVRPVNESEVLTNSGLIREIYVKEGDTVNAGDPLFSYDTSETEKQLESAKEELKNLQNEQIKEQTQSVYAQKGATLSEYAQNAVSLAQTSGYELYHYNNEIANILAEGLSNRLVAAVGSDIESLIETYLPQIESVLSTNSIVLPQEETDSLLAIDKSGSLAEQVKSAQQNVSTLEDKVDSMKVGSGISGKVLKVGIREGETVAANATAIVIADTDDMEVVSSVSGKDVKSLKEGMDAIIYSVDGERKYSGKILEIGQMVNASDGVGSENMTDLIVNPNNGLGELPGSNIDLEIVLSQKKGVDIISLDCLTADGYVFVVDSNNRIHKRTVLKGMQDDYNVEIKGGIAEGEKLVLNPDKNLKDGQKVAIID
jgi:HlyD family secretion protein